MVGVLAVKPELQRVGEVPDTHGASAGGSVGEEHRQKVRVLAVVEPAETLPVLAFGVEVAVGGTRVSLEIAGLRHSHVRLLRHLEVGGSGASHNEPGSQYVVFHGLRRFHGFEQVIGVRTMKSRWFAFSVPGGILFSAHGGSPT